jgi:acetoin utilization protein AcuC
LRTAFIYSNEYDKYDYGPDHPLKIYRLRLTKELIDAFELLNLKDTYLWNAEKASRSEIETFHEKDYIDILEKVNSGQLLPGIGRYGLGPGDNPVFKGLFDWSRLVTGASLQGARAILKGDVSIAFNIAGGLHHAQRSMASGFCYVNDPVIAILELLKAGKRVAYIDIDAHHGDGVQKAFYDTDQVITISIHQDGRTLFPGTGFVEEMGMGKGFGYSINVPLWPGTDDDLYKMAFEEVVPPIIEAFRPDIVVTQLGVDTFHSDPLANLSVTTEGFCHVVRMIKGLSPCWLSLGGGGYDVGNVVRAWTLAWAIMNDIDLPDYFPEHYRGKAEAFGIKETRLRDRPLSPSPWRERAKDHLQRVIMDIKEKIFPILTQVVS